jgi:hypothetical protein
MLTAGKRGRRDLGGLPKGAWNLRTPYYSDMSLVMAEKFNDTLKGDLPVEQALAELLTELLNIVREG